MNEQTCIKIENTASYNLHDSEARNCLKFKVVTTDNTNCELAEFDSFDKAKEFSLQYNDPAKNMSVSEFVALWIKVKNAMKD